MHPIVPLLQLLYVLKRVEGRKKLQKMVHILQACGAPFLERFEYSYYGMYSAQLRSEIERLESEGFVRERKNRDSEYVCYSLESTDELGKLIESLKCQEKPEWAALALELNGYSSQKLEALSTILFLQDCSMKPEMLKPRFLALKPRLAKYFEDALKIANTRLRHKTLQTN